MTRCDHIRVFDVISSCVALALLSPLLLLTALILRFTGEGEVIYLQKRVGVGGQDFGMYKFVTMRRDSERLKGGLMTAKGDPRVLPVGRVLRKTKINELLQFINVVIGDMSIVGPRPQVRPHFEAYSERVQRELEKLRPGVTGIGSIVFRDEEDILAAAGDDRERVYREVIAPLKGDLECWYLQHRSLRLDLLLCFITAAFLVWPQPRLLWALFKDLPRPEPEIAEFLGVQDLASTAGQQRVSQAG
ncbi:MAG: sugar transferase [Acidobacteria bacterium]|nr:sugar transferase [Acidobacteriota bacterium]